MVAIIVGLVATLIIAVVGLGVDVVGWYRTDRAMQNAADSAAVAAAENGTSSYQNEAKAVAAQYGYVDGSSGVTVTAVNNQACPDPTTEANCVKVSVAMATAPQFFSQVIGFPAPPLTSASMASGAVKHKYCLLALASSGTDPAILSHGAPNADLTNCTVMSNTGSTCTGHNLNATYGDAHGTNNGCGITENSNVPTVSDPYSYLASNIPADPCGGSYPSEAGKKAGPLPPSNIWGVSGATSPTAITLTNSATIAPTVGNGIVCGDLQLASDVTLTTASPGSLLIIYNGGLDTNGFTLSTASGSALTIIFTGSDPAGKYQHTLYVKNGTLNFNAPTSGTWSGVAIYTDPGLTKNVDFSYAGNTPTWDITGLTYFPHASITFSGAVNKSSNGQSCFVLVGDNININGTGDILETGGCAAAGLAMPTDNVKGTSLVQ